MYYLPMNYGSPIARSYVALFTLLLGVLLFPSCDKEESDPDPTSKTYKLTLTESQRGKITQDPNQASFKSGAEVSLTPVPNEGYEFSGWMENDVPKGKEKDNPLKLTMDDDKVIAATFAKQADDLYTLTLTTPENGKVEGHQASYVKDAETNIEAKPDDGYYFKKWTGGVPTELESNNPLQLKMTKNLSLGVEFVKKRAGVSHKLTLTAPENGTVSHSPDQTTFEDGDRVSLTAKPSSGYVFSHWKDLPDAHKYDNPLQIVMTQNQTLEAVFVEKAELTLTSSPNSGGTIEHSPDQTTFKKGEKVEITPIANEGYEFTGWTGDVPTGKDKESVLSLTMDDDKMITATFAKKSYALTVNATGGTVAKSPDKAKYGHGETVTLTPTANAGYVFKGWMGVVLADKTKNPLTLTMDAAKTITPVFDKKTYTLTVNATHGSVAKAPNKTTFNSGDSVTLTAKADAGYGFDGWSGHNIPKGYEKANPLTIGVTSNTTINAHFLTPIYLADNNFSLKARSFTKGGETYTYNGKTYTIAADKTALLQAISKSKDMSLYITTKVTNMNNMFISSDFNGDISKWDVSNVTQMSNMFKGTTKFNGDIRSWDVSKVTDMNSMFQNAAAFNQNIGGWDVSKVINMTAMFGYAIVFDQDLSGWCVKQVQYKSSFDFGATQWNKTTGRKPDWNKDCSAR